MSTPKPLNESLPLELIEAVLDGLVPIVPNRAAGMKARLMERVARAEGVEAAGITTIRAIEGDWAPFAPGVEAKVLFDDGRTQTWLARMQRDATLAGHVHEFDEECFLLEGTLFLDQVRMQPGDYQVARAGTRHEQTYSPTGCLMLVRSPSPRLLATA